MPTRRLRRFLRALYAASLPALRAYIIFQQSPVSSLLMLDDDGIFNWLHTTTHCHGRDGFGLAQREFIFTGRVFTDDSEPASFLAWRQH